MEPLYPFPDVTYAFRKQSIFIGTVDGYDMWLDTEGTSDQTFRSAYLLVNPKMFPSFDWVSVDRLPYVEIPDPVKDFIRAHNNMRS